MRSKITGAGSGLLDAAESGFFFLYAADEVVKLFAGGVGEGVEKFV